MLLLIVTPVVPPEATILTPIAASEVLPCGVIVKPSIFAPEAVMSTACPLAGLIVGLPVPWIVRFVLLTTTFSVYVPAPTEMVSPEDAAVMASPMVVWSQPLEHTVKVAARTRLTTKIAATRNIARANAIKMRDGVDRSCRCCKALMPAPAGQLPAGGAAGTIFNFGGDHSDPARIRLPKSNIGHAT